MGVLYTQVLTQHHPAGPRKERTLIRRIILQFAAVIAIALALVASLTTPAQAASTPLVVDPVYPYTVTIPLGKPIKWSVEQNGMPSILTSTGFVSVDRFLLPCGPVYPSVSCIQQFPAVGTYKVPVKWQKLLYSYPTPYYYNLKITYVTVVVTSG
jgi:hypothetical protein